jgi:hypothetical protein
MKKLKEIIAKVLDAITTPFASFAVGLDESRRINENGTWDKYWARKNKTRP